MALGRNTQFAPLVPPQGTSWLDELKKRTGTVPNDETPNHVATIPALEGMTQGEDQQRPPTPNLETANPNAKPLPPLDPNAGLSPLEIARKELNDAVSAPPEKQKAWKNGLFLALQAIQHITNPQDNTPIEMLGDVRQRNKILKAQQKLAPLDAAEAQRLGQEKIKEQTATIKRDDDVNLFKANLMAERVATDEEYKDNLIKLGFEKASQVKANQEAILHLRERGADQGDIRIKQYQDRIDEIKRHNQVTEKDKVTERDFKTERDNIAQKAKLALETHKATLKRIQTERNAAIKADLIKQAAEQKKQLMDYQTQLMNQQNQPQQ